MIDTVVIQPGADTGEPSVAGVSWAAVAAGAVVSCALTLVVLAFGIGLGLSVVSPWGGSGVSATTFKIGTGLYLVVIAMLSSSIGGYIAGPPALAMDWRSRRRGVFPRYRAWLRSLGTCHRVGSRLAGVTRLKPFGWHRRRRHARRGLIRQSDGTDGRLRRYASAV